MSDAPVRIGAPALPQTGATRLFIDRQFLRFLIVGGLNTVVGYALLWFALAITPTTFLAVCLSMGLAIPLNFVTNGTLVFRGAKSEVPARYRLMRFFGVYSVIFVSNSVGMDLLERAGLDPRVAALLLLPVAVAISYLLNRLFVFRAAL